MSNIDIQQFRKKITKGINQAVQFAITSHLRQGNPIFIIRNGKLTKVLRIRAKNK